MRTYTPCAAAVSCACAIRTFYALLLRVGAQVGAQAPMWWAGLQQRRS